jgi:hypothetical protein
LYLLVSFCDRNLNPRDSSIKGRGSLIEGIYKKYVNVN